jgi:predicted homoserine dehydrogenase-like protein
MFNSFLDGSKPAIECAAIANATGLDVPEKGLTYPSGSIDDIPTLMRPTKEGGILSHEGMVEVVSSLKPDGTEIDYNIRNGVWVCVEADTEYLKRCFEEYKVVTDESGRYMCLYKRWHLIGLELGMSVASVAFRQEPTGVAAGFNADVVATSKCKLSPGDTLDGEGGFTVYGTLLPAEKSINGRYLPLGLAHNIRVTKPVSPDQLLRWEDVTADETTQAYKVRMQLEESAYKIPAPD